MEYLRVLLPSIGVALIFYFVIRAIVHADRNERLQMEAFYAEQDAEVAEQDVEEIAEPVKGEGGHNPQGRETP